MCLATNAGVRYFMRCFLGGDTVPGHSSSGTEDKVIRTVEVLVMLLLAFLLDSFGGLEVYR